MNGKIDIPRIEAWKSFLKTHSLLLNLLEKKLAESEMIPFSWYDVLMTLSRSSGQRLYMHEIAQEVLISRSGITRLVDKLEKAGLIYRHICTEDRRYLYAVLGERGKEELKKAIPVVTETLYGAFGRHLDDGEVKMLNELFHRILRNQGN